MTQHPDLDVTMTLHYMCYPTEPSECSVFNDMIWHVSFGLFQEVKKQKLCDEVPKTKQVLFNALH